MRLIGTTENFASRPAGFGLYLHIPYCRALCHYCDFAKTANFTARHGEAYLVKLRDHLSGWLPELTPYLGAGITSVFFGGGTPSLFAAEYTDIFTLLAPHLAIDAEITLEANPDDITESALATWRALGFNRLSVGVQTFDPRGLTQLKRIHTAARASTAIQLARPYFAQLNIDLIYGWPGQTLASWGDDLDVTLALSLEHLSLYNLTYEERTPLGRAVNRGLLVPTEEERLYQYYELAREKLATHGFVHEEVSNWAKPGKSCRHNWLYWRDQSFLGVGAGAHSYLAAPGQPGLRFAYPRNDRTFLRSAPSMMGDDLNVERFGAIAEKHRTLSDWWTEVVGAGLRTLAGVDLHRALATGRWQFRPTPILKRGFDEGLLTIDGMGILRLAEQEWFREAGWGVEVLRSCV